MPIFPVAQSRVPGLAICCIALKGESQQKARGPGGARYLSQVWGQLPSRLFFPDAFTAPLGGTIRGNINFRDPAQLPGPPRPRVCAHRKDCCSGSGRERAAQRSSTRHRLGEGMCHGLFLLLLLFFFPPLPCVREPIVTTINTSGLLLLICILLLNWVCSTVNRPC